MVAGRQIGELFQMLRAQRRCDIVFLGEPFAEINQLATMRTEWAVFVCEPITAFLARRAFDLCRGAHVQFNSPTDFRTHRFQVRRHADGGGALHRADFEDGLDVLDGLIELQR